MERIKIYERTNQELNRLDLFLKNSGVYSGRRCRYFDTTAYVAYGERYGDWFISNYYNEMFHGCKKFIDKFCDSIDNSILNFCRSLLVENDSYDNINIAYEILQSKSVEMFKKKALIKNHGNYHKYDKDKNLKHLNKW